MRAANSIPTWVVALATLSLLWLPGCADGPVPTIARLNPVLRRQWAEDEAYRPTLHVQLEELEGLREYADELTPAEQVHWSRQLAGIYAEASSPVLRKSIVETLALIPAVDAEAGLSAALNDADATVRASACDAWAHRGGPQALQVLAIQLRSDTDTDVRLAAARGLGQFSDPLAVQALGSALEDDDPAMQYRAMRSLQESTGLSYGLNVATWRDVVQGRTPADPPPYSVVERVQDWFRLR